MVIAGSQRSMESPVCFETDTEQRGPHIKVSTLCERNNIGVTHEGLCIVLDVNPRVSMETQLLEANRLL